MDNSFVGFDSEHTVDSSQTPESENSISWHQLLISDDNQIETSNRLPANESTISTSTVNSIELGTFRNGINGGLQSRLPEDSRTRMGFPFSFRGPWSEDFITKLRGHDKFERFEPRSDTEYQNYYDTDSRSTFPILKPEPEAENFYIRGRRIFIVTNPDLKVYSSPQVQTFDDQGK